MYISIINLFLEEGGGLLYTWNDLGALDGKVFIVSLFPYDLYDPSSTFSHHRHYMCTVYNAWKERWMILLLIIFIYGSSIIKILRHEWVIERLLLQGLGAKVRGQNGG